MRLLGFLASVAAAASFGRGRGRGRWQGGECGLYVHASTPSPTTCWSRGISVLNYIVPKKKKGVRPRFCLTRLKKRRIIGNLVKRSKRHTWTSKRRLAMEVDAVKQVEEEEKRRRRAVEDRPLLLQLRRQQQRAGRVRRILGEQRTFADKAADVYAELIRLRAAGKPLSQLSYDGIDRWFKSDTAAFAGQRSAEPGRAQVASALESNGSVFHGLGWLGRGRWNVHTTTIDDAGVCRRCHEQLSTYKTDAQEADKFARHMVNLASKSVHRLHFDMFSDWMHLTSYDAILDGLSLRRCNVDSRLKLVRSATFHDIVLEISGGGAANAVPQVLGCARHRGSSCERELTGGWGSQAVSVPAETRQGALHGAQGSGLDLVVACPLCCHEARMHAAHQRHPGEAEKAIPRHVLTQVDGEASGSF
ncbi:uncharacterized protein LOC112342118 isoform X3 [Selaginella moellendorffii]|uniref:uncharacterized protein LOC112342118 isoform X3 n=1 Tax=Selaginella moellendorffii TaxID=88036 RepID=UPI000D1C72A9|nr:uncharacterized protein LOC112342118 isoform X3 [Selaginella moellendorffii]|eukprot:XP_024519185.1 uncharacterized protein LOC112342118 isoform X3 [Selaginella moellendorffii]